jgi:cysteine-rich repeat protein
MVRVLGCVAAVLAVAGCSNIDTFYCAPNFFCPAGTECDAENERCLTDEQKANCADKQEGEVCQISKGGGICVLGACLVPICGNDEVEPGEMCDDGNTTPLDGCSFDCRSDETCGNNVTDLLLGETCDDGNLLSHDGCGICQTEVPFWTPSRFIGTGPAREKHSLAYDSSRGRVVLFGGTFNGPPLDDTWEWDGSGWQQIDTVTQGPSPRTGAAMAYDVARRRVVLFGGDMQGEDRSTWEWDGATWKNVIASGATIPFRRSGHAMAYHAARRRVILYGGFDSGTLDQKTWEWDGQSWTVVATTGPDFRYDHAMAYDPRRNRMVVFGGLTDIDTDTGGGTSRSDTWEWDGATWTRVQNDVAQPAPRRGHAMAYDPTRQTILLFGGRNQAGVNLSDFWEWDGTTWTQIAATGPSGRIDHDMVFDLAHSGIFLSGGNGGTETLGDPWVFTAGEWRGFSNRNWPLVLREHAAAYDPLRGRIVMFGGVTATSTPTREDEVWELVGLGWEHPEPVTRPSSRFQHAMAYDVAARKILVTGGLDPALNGQSWHWDGTTWTDVTGGGALAVHSHAMTTDTARNRVVLFGGFDGSNAATDGLWEWDGGGWTHRPLAIGDPVPPARQQHAIAYDVHRQKTVLFSGDSVAGFIADVWEWDGIGWTERLPIQSPPARTNHVFVYDPALRNAVVMGGGFSSSSRSDIWAWEPGADGAPDAWREIVPLSNRPPQQLQHAASYDALRRELVILGKDAPVSPASTTLEIWRLQYRVPGAVPESCLFGRDVDGDTLIGCDDPDCWGFCTPLCPFGAEWCQADPGPRCGDGQCNPYLENHRLCPSDCSAAALCGDFFCDAPETAATCPGDCL